MGKSRDSRDRISITENFWFKAPSFARRLFLLVYVNINNSKYQKKMKARYRYRCYPTPSQNLALAKLFGCVRVVWNDSLVFGISEYIEGQKEPKNAEIQKQFITQAKKLEEREWLSEVSAVPLQQSLNDLEQAYQNFFNSCKGKRQGQKVKPPRFKKRKSKQSARFTLTRIFHQR
jgi:putative transposase